MRCSLLLAVLAACGPPAPVAPTSAPSAAETAGFDWQVRADCPLRYLVQVTKSQEMLGAQGEPPFAGPSIVTEAEVTMERDDDLVALRTKALRVAFAGEPQIRTPWISDDEHPPADVLLVEGERGFEETEGTTTMWSAAAKGGLLSLLWPPLPGTTQIGDRESWPLRLASPRAILQTEMARGAGRGKTLPPGSMPAPSEERLLTTGAVTVSELLVGPYPTVVLTGRWSEDISESIRQELPAMEGRRPNATASPRWVVPPSCPRSPSATARCSSDGWARPPCPSSLPIRWPTFTSS